MRGSVVKEHRRTAARVATKTVDAIAPALQAVFHNAEITKGRVDALEEVRDRSLRGRLRWLFTGK